MPLFNLFFLGLGCWPWVGEFVGFMIICIRFTAQHNLVNRKDPTVSCGRCRPDCILWPMPTRPHPVADARQTVPCGRCRSGCIVCPMPTQLYRVADAMPDQAVSCGRCRPDCIVWPNPNRPDCIVWPDPNRPGCIVWLSLIHI